MSSDSTPTHQQGQHSLGLLSKCPLEVNLLQMLSCTEEVMLASGSSARYAGCTTKDRKALQRGLKRARKILAGTSSTFCPLAGDPGSRRPAQTDSETLFLPGQDGSWTITTAVTAIILISIVSYLELWKGWLEISF